MSTSNIHSEYLGFSTAAEALCETITHNYSGKTTIGIFVPDMCRHTYCLLGTVELTSDEELEGPMKDQPLSADASPTALSPGYIANSDPEEDKEDPEEDPADHPADG
ncbi:hypothetical protein Tco_1418391 [Tanacetum coccineum]